MPCVSFAWRLTTWQATTVIDMPGDGMTDDTLGMLGKVIGDAVVASIARSSMYISQRESPLGRYRHCAAVRRRMCELPEDKWECAQVGRFYYLTPEGLRQELIRLAMSRGVAKAKLPEVAVPVERDAGAKLLSDLRRLRGA